MNRKGLKGERGSSMLDVVEELVSIGKSDLESRFGVDFGPMEVHLPPMT